MCVCVCTISSFHEDGQREGVLPVLGVITEALFAHLSRNEGEVFTCEFLLGARWKQVTLRAGHSTAGGVAEGRQLGTVGEGGQEGDTTPHVRIKLKRNMIHFVVFSRPGEWEDGRMKTLERDGETYLTSLTESLCTLMNAWRQWRGSSLSDWRYGNWTGLWLKKLTSFISPKRKYSGSPDSYFL